MSTCLICQKEYKTNRALATHLQVSHKIGTIDYTIQYVYNGTRPTCRLCPNETRYFLFSFKKFCRDHTKEAESYGGMVSTGIRGKPAWNKGQTKETNETIKRQAENQTGSGNQFYGKKHSQETIDGWKKSKRITQQKFEERVQSFSTRFIIKTPYEEYYSRQQQYLEVECIKCHKEDKKTLLALERGSLCWFCNKPNITSIPQRQITDFIRSKNIECVENDKTIIGPKHLDIYCPSQKFAIEFNGLHWHSEEKVGKYYHYDKTKECFEKGVTLFHIFSDEWENKQNIVLSMISHRLGITKNKIFARLCSIREIDNNLAHLFFKENHIGGSARCQKAFGLFYNDELVSSISFKKPIQKGKYPNAIEVVRFATKIDNAIIGGFSKLFKHSLKWIKEEGFEKVLCYSDNRFGQGNVYKTYGFEEVGKTGIDYWYTDGFERHFRFKFRAQPGKPEKQVAEENEVFPVYGCGSRIWVYNPLTK